MKALFFFMAALAFAKDADTVKPKDLEDFKIGIEISEMLGADQAGRFGYTVLQKKGYSQEILSAHVKVGKYVDQLDLIHAKRMEEIIKRRGWITISDFGEYVSHNAWLLVQHADKNIKFQELCLKLMEPHIESKNIRLENYAYLYDRVQVNNNRPQRFGTQGKCKGAGKWEPEKLENPEKLEEYRKQYEMTPYSEYLKLVSTLCLN